jgi:putative phosphonate metabolism protein
VSETRPRYAIYFAPAPGSALDALGRRWLGRDAESGQPVAQPDVPGIAELTAEARHYGFHATLKPPFSLANGASEAMLLAALADFTPTRRKVVAPPPKLAAISGFLALVPSAPAEELHRLADLCVSRFDRFRLPPDEAELAKRRKARLTPEQDALLLRWGYPYVFEEFRFHMTLTRRLKPEERPAIEAALAPLVAPAIGSPLLIDALSLFVQAGRASPFRLVRRFPLG